jgi:hypothetical protein
MIIVLSEEAKTGILYTIHNSLELLRIELIPSRAHLVETRVLHTSYERHQ